MTGRMRGIPEYPEGLVYRPDVLDEAEERSILGLLDEVEFHEVRMHGQVARRTVRHYDLDYGYESWQLVPTDPLPEPLRWLRHRCADLAGVAPEELAQSLVTRYPPGATIGWHRDAPMFGPVIAGVSLLAPCPMRFQRRAGDSRYVYEQELVPRSVYLLGGAARSVWQHSIPAVPHLRYSITFRTLRNPERWLPATPVTGGG
ncbi:alpha-ketoglutarate-dependent dioxygenase AlkB [Planosporangium mesophilum]|uniref:2OG-Fe(II) oxygenase n=1 Tax=Planosporangium mesophilum TaxID=689768 RepID=A0A8J3T6Q9_9ACTN|nr:alpha-ketoglutarate-dependent dioxygenase AlkB [Planosporangium mesophilum]NJC81454.1 alpha-ketoglutarate-dependent dioxygenase AlkB [Planosporangium mesophilum]GII20889.1 2OG-Fe(II) oxygenase [Planosporangium mesophilum]